MNTQLVDRYLYPSGSEIWQDPNGLLINLSSMSQPHLIGLNEVVELPGGILLAEGGMGKTTWILYRRVPSYSLRLNVRQTNSINSARSSGKSSNRGPINIPPIIKYSKIYQPKLSKISMFTLHIEKARGRLFPQA